jgi:hypothetical protein
MTIIPFVDAPNIAYQQTNSVSGSTRAGLGGKPLLEEALQQALAKGQGRFPRHAGGLPPRPASLQQPLASRAMDPAAWVQPPELDTPVSMAMQARPGSSIPTTGRPGPARLVLTR